MSQPGLSREATASMMAMLSEAESMTAQPGRVRAPRGLGPSLVDLMVATLRRGSVSECLIWPLGGKDGYGVVAIGGRTLRVHRHIYEQVVQPVPVGLDLDHLCRNRACFNPAHLEPVTSRENTMRGAGVAPAKAAQTHCVHGHEFTPENTYTKANGCRSCRTCSRASDRSYNKKRRAA